MSDVIKISRRIGWRKIDNAVVVFNCSNQELSILNESASELWDSLVIGANIEQLKALLRDRYLLKMAQAEKDVLNFLKELSQSGFIIIPSYSWEVNKPKNDDDNKKGEDLLLEIELRAIEKLIPFAVTFETTYSCNENCIHCYMDRNRASLPLSQIKRILAELANENCLFLSLTGGEFFTRPDALEIIRFADELHFVIDILSNGLCIDEKIARQLSDYSVRRVQISLYGSNPKTHDSITRVPNSFRKTIGAIKFLRQSNIKVEIAFPMMNINFDERYELKDIAESMDCVLSPSPFITARNNGNRDTFQFRLTDEQLTAFIDDKDFSEMYAGRKPFKEHKLYFNFSDIREAAPCYSGFNSCAITPSGKVLPCNQLILEVGDLMKNSFSEIWRNSGPLRMLRNLKIRDLGECSECKLLSNCNRCPGLAYIEYGDLLGPSPESCRVTNICDRLSSKGG